MEVMNCGVFSCPKHDCPHHIRNGDGYDMPTSFNNLKGTEMCILDRDCENCANKVDGDCQVWECKFVRKEPK